MVLKCSIADMTNDQTLQSTLLEYFHFPKMDTGKTFNVFYLTCWLRVCCQESTKKDEKREIITEPVIHVTIQLTLGL